MAKKITELTALTTTAEDDLLVIEDISTSTTKKITKADFLRTIVTDDITVSGTATSEGWSPLGATPNTVTNNGNRSYDLVFNSTDLTDTLSPGMRLKATRTVTAPTQCTDLEASSSQYYNDTSVSGMTFTDDFVVSAWVKVESYALMTIASRYNGTSGWQLRLDATGQLVLIGYNAASGNFSAVVSYQSVPRGKWVHVAAQLDMSTFTATTTTSYTMIDGVDVPASVTRGGTNPTALIQAGNLEIGGNNGGSNPFDGKLAQVAIYSAKVTQATIKASMSQTLTGSETSLISAYSFNNSIADLNTSNANNLTAQGSAVATNADTPFAGGATGTTEYGIVMAAAFSTNTTLTVQVPEGYAIPTSGGVSAVSYSTHSTPYGFPRQKGKWRVEQVLRVQQNMPGATAGTWYNVGASLNIPIGSWMAGYSMTVGGGETGNSYGLQYTLSSANNSESNSDFTRGHYVGATGATNVNPMSTTTISCPLELSVATQYYFNISTDINGDGISIYGDYGSGVITNFITAECAYV